MKCFRLIFFDIVESVYDIASYFSLTNLIIVISRLLALIILFWMARAYLSSLGLSVQIKKVPLTILLVIILIWDLIFTFMPVSDGPAEIRIYTALPILLISVALSFVIAVGNRLLIFLAGISLYLMLLLSEILMHEILAALNLDHGDLSIYAVAVTLRVIFLTLCIYLVKKIVDFEHRRSDSTDFISIMPFLLILVCNAAISFYIFNLTQTNQLESSHGIWIIGILVVATLAITTTFFTISRQAQTAQELTVYQQQLQHFNSLLQQREADYLYSKALKHDQKQHAMYLTSALENGEIAEAKTYLHSMLQSEPSGESMRTENRVVDALLSHKHQQLVENKIKLEHSISIPKQVDVDDVDLCIVLGNLLDNAIEATRKVAVEDRIIHLTILYRAGQNLLITIKNPYHAQIKRGGIGGILSTKSNQKLHGIGLYSIQEAIKKCHGELQIEHDDTHFEATVLMYGAGDDDA